MKRRGNQKTTLNLVQASKLKTGKRAPKLLSVLSNIARNPANSGIPENSAYGKVRRRGVFNFCFNEKNHTQKMRLFALRLTFRDKPRLFNKYLLTTQEYELDVFKEPAGNSIAAAVPGNI